MIGVETIARIRFEHFQNGKGVKRITRELGIARDTVRKVLLSGGCSRSCAGADIMARMTAWIGS